jgi:hypothetical protein
VIQGKIRNVGPGCDEAPTVGALVHDGPLLEVACDIWNLDWGPRSNWKVLPGKE